MDLATKAAIDRLRKIAVHGPALVSVSREDAQRILAELDIQTHDAGFLKANPCPCDERKWAKSNEPPDLQTTMASTNLHVEPILAWDRGGPLRGPATIETLGGHEIHVPGRHHR